MTNDGYDNDDMRIFQMRIEMKNEKIRKTNKNLKTPTWKANKEEFISFQRRRRTFLNFKRTTITIVVLICHILKCVS